jgi:hypothetical protein
MCCVYDGLEPYNHYEPQQDTNNPNPCMFVCMHACIYAYDIFYKLSMSMGNVSWVVCVKENMIFEFQRLSTFVFFCFPQKGRIWSCPSFEDLPAYIILWSHNDWCKFSSISEILTYDILECLKVNKNKMFRVEITLSGMTSLSVEYRSTNWFESY